MSLDTYPVAHVDALKARIATLERELEQAKEDRARAAMDARNPLLARITALRAAGDALARHVAEDTRGQTSRQLVQAWEEASR